MKSFIKSITIAAIVFITLVFTPSAFAQDPPPPPGGGHESGGNEIPGGGAPIGGGALILTLLATGYGLKKWYGDRAEKKL